MSWETLPKEKKQFVFLGVIIGLALIYVAYQFGYTPLADRVDNMTEEIDSLRTRVDKADRLISQESAIHVNLEDARSQLEAVMAKDIPPVDNALSWASRVINEASHAIGIDVDSIVPVIAEPPWLAASAGKKDPPRKFSSYSVQINLRCTYAECVRLFEKLEQSNPVLTIRQLAIGSQPSTPELHAVSAMLSWPVPIVSVFDLPPAEPAAAEGAGSEAPPPPAEEGF